MHIVDDCQLPIDSLFFVDELVEIYGELDIQIEETILVDHNELDPSQRQFGRNVTRVVDHHIDMK